MTPSQITSRLLAMGFSLGENQKDEQTKDLGFYREWLIYLKREVSGSSSPHQYLWLTTYDDRFVEAILFTYPKPFNSRARPAMQPTQCCICRTMEEIEKAVA